MFSVPGWNLQQCKRLEQLSDMRTVPTRILFKQCIFDKLRSVSRRQLRRNCRIKFVCVFWPLSCRLLFEFARVGDVFRHMLSRIRMSTGECQWNDSHLSDGDVFFTRPRELLSMPSRNI